MFGKYVNLWIQKHGPLGMQAVGPARYWVGLWAMLKVANDTKAGRKFWDSLEYVPRSEIEEWGSFYRDSKKVFRAYEEITSQFIPPEIQSLVKSARARLAPSVPLHKATNGLLRKFKAASEKERAEMVPDMKKAIDTMGSLLREGLPPLLKSMHAFAENLSPADDAQWSREILERPAIRFMLLICFPCWVEYGEHPWVLFRRARNGCCESADKLFRLDKRVLHCDRRLGQHLVDLQDSGSPDYDFLMKSLRASPKGLWNEEKVKTAIAGYIWYSSQGQARTMMVQPMLKNAIVGSVEAKVQGLSADDIQELFDAFEKDKTGKRSAVDLDFDPDPAVSKKRIHRAGHKWAGVLPKKLRWGKSLE